MDIMDTNTGCFHDFILQTLAYFLPNERSKFEKMLPLIYFVQKKK